MPRQWQSVYESLAFNPIALKAMVWLRKETVIRVGQRFRSLGGDGTLPPQVVAECFSRMSQWVSLAEETLKAEWPSFEAIQAFSVFQLTPRLETAVVKRDLGKISQVFQEKHNLPALVKSFADCEYTAAKRSSWHIKVSIFVIIVFEMLLIRFK